MKQSSFCIDAQASQAIEQLSRAFGVSKAEIVRRCVVAMHKAHNQDEIPEMVEGGYDDSEDDRTKRGAVGFARDLGRAPDLGDLPDGTSEQSAGVGMGRAPKGSPEDGKRGDPSEDEERESFLDKRLW